MTPTCAKHATLHANRVQGQVWAIAPLAGMANHFLAEQEDFAGTQTDQGKQQPKREIPGQLFH